MNRSRYLVGIDLGTTNCAVAYVDTQGRGRVAADIRDFPAPQLVAPGETSARSMLPSFLYLPGRHELPQDAAKLPWNPEATRIVGEFARIQGAKVPGRLVSSAKSWLCHPGVDRQAEILPWGAPAEVAKVSPVEASYAYLAHLRDAWNHEIAKGNDACRLENQDIVLTVPASFDEAARELTALAAGKAGFTSLTLLEEPQAAFYCWIVSHQDRWQREVRAGELILVCDIGGGTTDFSLITVVETPTGPGFRRVAVGDHLMLGGDNIDLALAHLVEQKLGGARLDAEQWNALRFSCRGAKEKLLGVDDPSARWPVVIAGRGSRLIGGGLQSELTRDEVESVAIDGFFGRVSRADDPERAGRSGLREFGLPFVADPAVLKHLGLFLRRHRAEAVTPEGHTPGDRPARPDAILFNGGALTPDVIRRRIVEVVTSWFADDDGPEYTPRVLANPSLDLAVARGAAYYGVVRRGGGIRIGGGTARSFYIGLETGDVNRPWLCVVPRDAQEGTEIAITGHDFDLLTGRPVVFPLASSSVRPDDRPGQLVRADADSIRVLPPLESLMRIGRKAKVDRAAVSLAARVTEVGTIELWCQSRTDDRRWRLQIQLRGPSGGRSSGDSPPASQIVLEQSELEVAIAAVRDSFTGAPGGCPPARLVKRLEELLDGPRELWPPSALRALWDPLKDCSESRLAGPGHESRWFNLAGFVLRPGLGFPRDDLRMKALWALFHQGVKSSKDVQSWAEWWILWRRVAAGLMRAHHEELERRLMPFLVPAKGSSPAKKAGRPKPEPHELAEMWRCAAALERAGLATKQALGDALISDRSTAPPAVLLWCLGRLGARTPLYASAESALPATVAERWLENLLGRDFAPGRETTDAVFALSELARVTLDRARDVDPALRVRVLDRLAALGAEESALAPVREHRERALAEQSAALGDTLPIGLRLTGSA